VTIGVAAWVSHRRSKEVEQLTDHYTVMLKVVAATTEDLFMLRTASARAGLERAAAGDRFTAPQERRVVADMLLFATFLHEVAGYFPSHAAAAARHRLIAARGAAEARALFAMAGAAAGAAGADNDKGGDGGGGARSGAAMASMIATMGAADGGGSPDSDDEDDDEDDDDDELDEEDEGAEHDDDDDAESGARGRRRRRRASNAARLGGAEGGMVAGAHKIGSESPYDGSGFTRAIRKRLATTMLISLLDFPSLEVKRAALATQLLCEAALSRIEASEGVVEILTPSYILASFNFHRPCVIRHPRLACECALSIHAFITHHPDMADLVHAITIDTTQIVGGTIGTNFKRAEAIAGEGVDIVQRLAPLANVIAVPILVTERVRAALGDLFDTAPVDVADVRWLQPGRQRHVTLFELRGSRLRTNTSAAAQLSDIFSDAFSHFRRGDLALCESELARWEREAKAVSAEFDDTQSRRLRAVCAMYRKHARTLTFPQPFTRRNIQWQLFHGEVPESGVSPLRERLLAARRVLEFGSASFVGSGGGNGRGSSTPAGGGGGGGSGTGAAVQELEETFRRMGDEQRARMRVEEGGLMDMFLAVDDDDEGGGAGANDDGAGVQPDADAALVLSPSYGALQIPRLNSPTPAASPLAATSPTPPAGGSRIVQSVIKDIAGETWTRSAEMIGSGGFSEVFMGLGQNGALVAMKFFLLEGARSSVEELKSEVTILSKLSHENIVSYVSCAFTPSHFIILMEYVAGGSLERLLRQFGPLPLPALKKYLADILRGLQYLHSKGSVHCDVKPHNALLHNDGVVKLTDFGSCINARENVGVHADDTRSARRGTMPPSAPSAAAAAATAGGEGDVVVRGTPHYMAPEAARNQILPASDVWSVGITVLELVTGHVPWSDRYRRMSPQNFVLALSSDDPPMPDIAANIDPRVQDFVRRCVVRNPASRNTIEQLLVSPLLAV
jgi:hypothetical protein